MSIRTKLAGTAAAGVLLAAGGMSIAAPAHASPLSQGSGGQYSYFGEYVNAWSGGPDVDGFNGTAENNDFTQTAGTSISNVFLRATGGETTYYNDCISDSGNNQYSARAGLVACNGSVPWGAVLVEQGCSGGGIAYYDNHWAGYLSFSSGSNGSAMYLNGPKTCFTESGAY